MNLSKNLMCIQMRSGVEVWLEDDRATNFKNVLLNTTSSKFVQLDREIINTADVVGVWTGETMETVTRRKNGQVKCSFGSWHDKGQKCDCADPRIIQREKELKNAIMVCGKCSDGWKTVDGEMVKCACIKNI